MLYKKDDHSGKPFYSIEKDSLYYDFDEQIRVVTFMDSGKNIFLLINSDFHDYAGVLFKVHNDIVLEITSPTNETLEHIKLELNYDHSFDIVHKTPKEISTNDKLWILCGSILALIIFVLAGLALKKVRKVRRMTGIIEGNYYNNDRR